MIVFSSVPIKKEFNYNMTPQEIIKHITPPAFAEYDSSLFQKYGYTTSGIGMVWHWRQAIVGAPTEDLWRMIALSTCYWLNESDYNKDVKDYKEYKEQLKIWGEKNPDFFKTLAMLEDQERKIYPNGIDKS